MKSFLLPPQSVLNSIKTCKRAVVCGHEAPDGDCANSVMAMGLLLKALGKEVYLVNDGPFFRPEIEFIKEKLTENLPEEILNKDTLGVVVDCSTFDRLGTKWEYFKNFTITVVDHHSSGVEFGDFRYIVPKSISTTLLIYQLYKALDVPLTQEVAQYIFRGFATDSGYFKFLHEDSGETLRIVADLADHGVVPNDEYHYISGGKSLSQVKFLGELINRVESFYDGKVLISHEEKEDFETYGDNARASDDLYASLTLVKGVQAVFFFKISKRKENSIEVGIRSNHSCSFNAGSFAALFGGGGHAKAAGLTLEGSFLEVKETILSRVKEFLD